MHFRSCQVRMIVITALEESIAPFKSQFAPLHFVGQESKKFGGGRGAVRESGYDVIEMALQHETDERQLQSIAAISEASKACARTLQRICAPATPSLSTTTAAPLNPLRVESELTSHPHVTTHKYGLVHVTDEQRTVLSQKHAPLTLSELQLCNGGNQGELRQMANGKWTWVRHQWFSVSL